MHQKKIPRVKNILHSIPILRKKVYGKKNPSSLSSFLNNRSIVIKNKHLRYVSSSIPLACSVALLLLSVCIVSPSSNPFISHADVYAEEDTSSSSGEADGGTEILNPTAELTVEGDLTQTTLAGLGSGPVYRSHNVSINVNDVTDYTLRVSYANGSNNALEYYGTSGDTVTTGGTSIGGVGNAVKSSSMPENSWGFGWSDNKDAGDNELDYYTMPNYGSNNTGIAGGVLVNNSNSEGISNTAEGKLVFAANFKNDAVAGHYKTKVLLSLAATPKKVTMSFTDITTLQEMTATICENAAEKDKATLIDSRDRNRYGIYKASDGNCWITDNLQIVNIPLAPENSDVFNSDFTVPKGDGSNVGSQAGENKSGARLSTRPGYGAYYTWCAATANSCLDAKVDGDIATSSICPKGWRLPTVQEYDTLVQKGGAWETRIISGVSNSGRTIDAIFFPATGYDAGGTRGENTNGAYWSSTSTDKPSSGSSSAYDIYFSDSNISTGTWGRYIGMPIRCIAKNAKDEHSQRLAEKGAVIEDWDKLEYMQQIGDNSSSSKACANAPASATKTLTDLRDGSTYEIKKAKDGHCWMNQNLSLDLDDITLTPGDSNVQTNWPSNSGPSELWSMPECADANTYEKRKICYSLVKYYNGSKSSDWKSLYGYYYSWGAATANIAKTITESNSQEASRDICPKGWRLPTFTEYTNLSKDSSEWGIGDGMYNGMSGLQIDNLFFPAAGNIYDASFSGSGYYGSYWSSTSQYGSSNYGAYILSFDNSGLTSTQSYRDYAIRASGVPVRCIAR